MVEIVLEDRTEVDSCREGQKTVESFKGFYRRKAITEHYPITYISQKYHFFL